MQPSDKPAEGLFATYIRRDTKADPSEGIEADTEYLVVLNEKPLWTFFTAGTAIHICDKINAAHASIVKPLREKAEKLEAKEKDWESAYKSLVAQFNEIQKDRDAWKEKAESVYADIFCEFYNSPTTIKGCPDCARDLARADADRLAGILMKIADMPVIDWCSDLCTKWEPAKMAKEALAAHEALKGKT